MSVISDPMNSSLILSSWLSDTSFYYDNSYATVSIVNLPTIRMNSNMMNDSSTTLNIATSPSNINTIMSTIMSSTPSSSGLSNLVKDYNRTRMLFFVIHILLYSFSHN